MSFEIVIPALATVFSPIITLIVKNIWDNKNVQSISSARKKAINRTWYGLIQYYVNNRKTESVPIQIFLESKRKIVSGHALYDSSDGETKLLLRGGFKSDSLLKLDYRNLYEHKLHFGVFILELNANSDSMKGAIIGHGRDPDGIFTATLELSNRIKQV